MKLDYERIILWVLVILMFVRLFVIRETYVASNPPSIMDLAEFSGIPDDIKQLWSDVVVNQLMDAVSEKVTQIWTSLSAAQKQAFTNEIRTAGTQLSTNVQEAPVTVESTPVSS